MKKEYTARSLRETAGIAHDLGGILYPGDVVLLKGTLGAGKTTFIKHIAERFGVDKNEITSGSFVIFREHKGRIPLYHVDLYRVESRAIPDEVYEAIYSKAGLTLIEWAEKISISECYFTISLSMLTLQSRKITITASSQSLKERLHNL